MRWPHWLLWLVWTLLAANASTGPERLLAVGVGLLLAGVCFLFVDHGKRGCRD